MGTLPELNNSELQARKPEPSHTWPRYDPSRDFWLCEGCWNNQDWAHNCAQGLCECPACNGMKPPKNVRFTGDGQLPLPETTPLIITKEASAEYIQQPKTERRQGA